MRNHFVFSVLILFSFFYYCLSCPFIKNLREEDQNIERDQSNKLKGPFCVKTLGRKLQPTKGNICRAYNIIQNSFETWIPNSTYILERSNIFGSAIRLAFHDAGEADLLLSEDKLGPDGCLSPSSDSAGLLESFSKVVTLFEPLWQRTCDLISRADFWVLLAKLSLEKSSNHSMEIPFQFGRQDNRHCQHGEGRLPETIGGLGEITRVFVQQMGLTIEDAVTLIGAHTIGHVHPENSGFDVTPFFLGNASNPVLNAWDSTPDQFDNRYYKNLINRIWQNVPTRNAARLPQWLSTTPTIMLNADISLGFPANLSHGVGSRLQICQPNLVPNVPVSCKDPVNNTVAPTFDLVHQYSLSNDLFLKSFPASFCKMVCVGYGVPAKEDGSTASGKLGRLTSIDFSTCPASNDDPPPVSKNSWWTNEFGFLGK
jgi:hypothetical protein